VNLVAERYMSRLLFAFTLAALAGCLPTGFRVGMPPVDRKSHEVRNKLGQVVPDGLKAAARAAAPPGTVPEFRGESCSGTSGEEEWSVDVRYVRPDGSVAPTDREACVRALAAGYVVVTNGMLGTSAGTLWLPDAPTSGAGLPTDGSGEHAVAFVVSYNRRNGAVVGEVVGRVSPSPTYPGFTRLKVIASEWCTE
jgi:hypothetical protein